MNNGIPQRLRFLRGEASQQQFGDLIGLPQRKLSRLETGTAPLDVDSTQKICKALNISADWLLFGRGPEPQEVSGIPPSHEEGRLAALEDERRELSAENRQLHHDKAALLQEVADMRERIARLEAQVTLSEVLKGGTADTAVPASAPSAPSTNPNNDRA